MAMTTIDIARAYGRAILNDRTLEAWARDTYGKPFVVHVGVNFRSLPTTADAPYIAVLPEAYGSGPQRGAVEHDLRVVVGIEDGDFADDGGLLVMRGLVRLSKDLVPEVERVMGFALPTIRPQEFAVAYSIMEFPLLEAVMEITVKESLPIGRRTP